MGFLDFLKKRSSTEKVESVESVPEKSKEEPIIKKEKKDRVDLVMKVNEDGLLQFDFYEFDAPFGQGYDVTRLIIKERDVFKEMEKPEVLKCLVSWYGMDDVQGGRYDSFMARENVYRRILAQIDLHLLASNPDYYKMVMRKLLNENRVKQYLAEGLKDAPDELCGQYIGGVVKVDGVYKRYFDPEIGEISHNSDEMKAKRAEIQSQKENARRAEIERKRAELKALEEDIYH